MSGFEDFNFDVLFDDVTNNTDSNGNQPFAFNNSADAFVSQPSASEFQDLFRFDIPASIGSMDSVFPRANVQFISQPLFQLPVFSAPPDAIKRQSGNRFMSGHQMDGFSPLPPTIEKVAANNTAEENFKQLMQNTQLLFNPYDLGFLPLAYWKDNSRDYTFGELVTDFFRKQNSLNTRFLHKLYNALRLSELSDFLADSTGVRWVTDELIAVNRVNFARLLGIKTINGSLFHSQGNFPTHGFKELNYEQAMLLYPGLDLTGIDFNNVRLLVHAQKLFVHGCDEQCFKQCKWSQNRKKDK